MAAFKGGSDSQGFHGYLPAKPEFGQAPHQSLGHQFQSSSIGNEFD